MISKYSDNFSFIYSYPINIVLNWSHTNYSKENVLERPSHFEIYILIFTKSYVFLINKTFFDNINYHLQY